MSYSKVPAGKDLPNDIYVAIEIPANHAPIKYEIDHDTDCLFVDRFMATPMFYPANYGFIPHTLADDGDPLDVLVVTPYPVAPGSVIRCRPVGVQVARRGGPEQQQEHDRAQRQHRGLDLQRGGAAARFLARLETLRQHLGQLPQ